MWEAWLHLYIQLLFICDFAQTSTILVLHTTDVIKGQWINFQDNGSKYIKDTEKKVVIFSTTKRDIIVKDYFYLLYTLGSADDAMATVCVLEKQVPSRSSGVCLRSLIFFLSLNINYFNEQWDILTFSKVNEFC